MAKILAILIYYQSSPLICQFISPQHCTSSQTVPVSNHSDALFKRCFLHYCQFYREKIISLLF